MNFSWSKLQKKSLEWPGVDLITMEHKYYIPFNGGSRISQIVRGVGQVVVVFDKLFCRKLHENERNWTGRLGRKGAYPYPSLGFAYAILSLGAQIQLCAVRNEDWRTLMISLYLYVLPSFERFLLCETTLLIKKKYYEVFSKNWDNWPKFDCAQF